MMQEKLNLFGLFIDLGLVFSMLGLAWLSGLYFYPLSTSIEGFWKVVAIDLTY